MTLLLLLLFIKFFLYLIQAVRDNMSYVVSCLNLLFTKYIRDFDLPNTREIANLHRQFIPIIIKAALKGDYNHVEDSLREYIGKLLLAKDPIMNWQVLTGTVDRYVFYIFKHIASSRIIPLHLGLDRIMFPIYDQLEQFCQSFIGSGLQQVLANVNYYLNITMIIIIIVIILRFFTKNK